MLHKYFSFLSVGMVNNAQFSTIFISLCSPSIGVIFHIYTSIIYRNQSKLLQKENIERGFTEQSVLLKVHTFLTTSVIMLLFSVM